MCRAATRCAVCARNRSCSIDARGAAHLANSDNDCGDREHRAGDSGEEGGIQEMMLINVEAEKWVEGEVQNRIMGITI